MMNTPCHSLTKAAASPGVCCLPAVKFTGLPALVHMRDRQVQARFCCQGRINKDPENFQPEWTPAQLILYEGPKALFSVLFDDIGDRYRHIMDFEPVPLPCSPTLSWLQTVQDSPVV